MRNPKRLAIKLTLGFFNLQDEMLCLTCSTFQLKATKVRKLLGLSWKPSDALRGYPFSTRPVAIRPVREGPVSAWGVGTGKTQRKQL